MSVSKVCLVGSNFWSGNNVGVEVAVDVRGVARVRALDVSRNLCSRRRLARAAASDLDLSASYVELGWAARVMDAELLDTEEVLSSRNLGGDSGGVSGCGTVSQS
jgi:hypothetical protein